MRLTEKVHQLLSAHVVDGDITIDATAGNGHDTVFLAKKVSPTGKVIAIDIQAAAIEATKQKLADAKLYKQAELITADHAEALQRLTAEYTCKVAAITFNLGYLPGSDKAVQTNATSTLRALDESISLLKSDGLLCVTAYRGHSGGMEESKQIEAWMLAKKDLAHAVESYEPESKNTPPILWLLRK